MGPCFQVGWAHATYEMRIKQLNIDTSINNKDYFQKCGIQEQKKNFSLRGCMNITEFWYSFCNVLYTLQIYCIHNALDS